MLRPHCCSSSRSIAPGAQSVKYCSTSAYKLAPGAASCLLLSVTAVEVEAAMVVVVVGGRAHSALRDEIREEIWSPSQLCVV